LKDLTLKSPTINNSIFQREINESIARCFIKLNMGTEALNLIQKLVRILQESNKNFVFFISKSNSNIFQGGDSPKF